jgi:alpha-tubulin suppressor-like RCC1 family protein
MTNQSDSTNDPTKKIIIESRTKTKPGFCLAVGENLSNQLGLSMDVTDRKKPQIVKELPEDIVEVAAGGMHSACLTEDGTVSFFSL